MVFSGGSLPVGMVADFKGESEKIGKALLKAYPDRLMDLDHVEEEKVISIESEKVAEEKPIENEVKSSSKVSKKSKKSNKK